MNKEFLKKNGGITLIALVITIVILIILATISINAVLGENGLIKRAEKAGQMQANAEKSESDAIDSLLHQAGVATGEIVVNPYDPDGWKYAWVCDNGTWGDKLETGATLPEGEGIVVAKFYETGKKITPLDIVDDEVTLSFPEGNEYVMVIEGQGKIGTLVGLDSDGNETYNAWMMETFDFIGQQSEICTIPYVLEAIICDGVTSIGMASFYCGAHLEKITISNTVTNIEDMAFSGSNLIDVTIPESVTSIGNMIFRGCENLKKLTINSEVAVDKKIFEECSSLTNVTIGGSVKTIKPFAFSGCTNLTNVIIGNSVTNICYNAFSGCKNLTNVVVGNNISIIESQVFYNCTNLTNITIPNSVTSIEESAFDECTSLKNITIPKSVTSIGNYAFEDCSSLTTVAIDSKAISSTITASDSNGNLVSYATTIYINEEIEEASIGSYITSNYTKQATSDKVGYVKYTK